MLLFVAENRDLHTVKVSFIAVFERGKYFIDQFRLVFCDNNGILNTLACGYRSFVTDALRVFIYNNVYTGLAILLCF